VRIGLCVVLAACGPAIRHARLSSSDPPSARELDAAERIAASPCSVGLHWLFPGIAQACLGRPYDAAVLATLGASELATGIAVGIANHQGLDHPGAALPLVAVQDLWIYSAYDADIELDRASRKLYAPQDTLGELAIAPFNLRVLSQTDVWAGILGVTALGIGVSLLVDESFDTTHAGERPNLFGRTFSRPIGYPVAGAVGIGLFEHVAIAEETVFRGDIQSSLARSTGETSAWLWGSAIFGGFHALNALFLPSDQRLEYLAIGVPFITLIGTWFGASYRHHGYSLAPSVAEHFWYDLLESTFFFALDPQHSPLSAGVTIPF
jgi:membrane protease YdiL (CAAX protease family)